MSKNLRKKLLRDLRQSAVQFTAIFIMCFLAMFIMTSFESDTAGTGNSVNNYFADMNFEDLSVSSEGFTDNDLLAIKSIPGVRDAEFRTSVNGKLRLAGREKKVEFNFLEQNNISGMLLAEGEPYQPGMAGIWIDTYFAQAQKISVGDTVTCVCGNTEFSEKVMGIMNAPDHLYFIIDNTFTEPQKGAYGYAFLDAGEYPGDTVVFDTILVDLEKVEHQLFLTENDLAVIEAAAAEIPRVISKMHLDVTMKQNETAYEFINDDMETHTMLGIVFPGLFIAITLLGIMSTMSRLVEKQRTLIGTLKALGFSRNTVILHYTSYSVVVSLLGSVSGTVLGWFTLGKYIHYQMNLFYYNPYARMELSFRNIALILLIALLAGLTNYVACRKLLVQRASDILRSAPPVVQGAGMIEKTFIWRKLGFSTKWNLRDINRNRVRTFAAFLGIMLCSALMLTAFGAYELVGSVAEWQYEELYPSRYTILFSPEASPGTVYDYTQQFHGQSIMKMSAELMTDDHHSMEFLTVIEAGNLCNFQDVDGNAILLPEYGISVSSKVADNYGIGIGDPIGFQLPGDQKYYSGRVVQIYKVPSGQGIAMKRSYYESLGLEYRPNIVYTNMTVPASYETDRAEVISVLDRGTLLKALEIASELTYTEIIVIMLIAVVMGVVVMYNLGIMSFSEKTREIATLKVLGFSTGKIRWILQQQNIVVTGVGTLAGLLVGLKTLVFTMDNLDDTLAYIYHLSPVPYILAFLLSFVLSIIVNELISRKVKEINMVDALKGVE